MNLAVTNLINSYHHFDRDFWLSYKTLEKLHPAFDSIKMVLLKSKRVDQKFLKDVDPIKYATERELLSKEWEHENEEAKQVGTTTHEYIHNLFCTNLKAVKSEFQIDTDLYAVQQLEAFLKCTSGIFIEHRLEVPVDQDYTLVGIPDCFVIHDGVVDIVDWKTNDKLSFKSMFEVGLKKSKRLKYPLSKLDDCNGIHYQLQLSLYMWMILQLRPDLKPGKLKIVWVKDNKIKKTFEVKYLDKDVDTLLKWHIRSLNLEKEFQKCREIEY